MKQNLFSGSSEQVASLAASYSPLAGPQQSAPHTILLNQWLKATAAPLSLWPAQLIVPAPGLYTLNITLLSPAGMGRALALYGRAGPTPATVTRHDFAVYLAEEPELEPGLVSLTRDLASNGTWHFAFYNDELSALVFGLAVGREEAAAAGGRRQLCRAGCSGNGRCLEDRCECNEGWGGTYCSKSKNNTFLHNLKVRKTKYFYLC
jgi:hypothetical protein